MGGSLITFGTEDGGDGYSDGCIGRRRGGEGEDFGEGIKRVLGGDGGGGGNADVRDVIALAGGS